jgi:DNA-binding HxlR family transcriptional regulator
MELFDLAGRRWTLRVLWELSQAGDPLTFRALRERCGEISSSVLTRRIAELRDARLVARVDDGYVLSDLGRSLVEAMQPLLDWSRAWARELEEPAQ